VIYALGRQPHDPVRLASAPAIFDHLALATPADRLDRSGVDFEPSLGDNDWAPDCTGESLREVATAIFALSAGARLSVAREASLAFYCSCVGLPPNATRAQILATDGAEMLAVARRQWRQGFDVGSQRLFGLFGTAPVADRLKLAAGAQAFRMLWAGVRIYERDRDNFDSADPWDDDGSTDPGALVGLHAIGTGWGWTGLGDSDETGTVTWGRCKPTKWRWLARRLDEVHCFRFRQLDGAGAAAIDEERLTAALTRWSAAA